ncbi:hypothetical protein [Neorhodopirellula lusitana]|uniref:hypothetical protein n=1 Tax=Neorhodopirellula lusitana TaxID=445327 RepID=UPI00384E4465
MISEEQLVAGLAFLFALLALAISIGPWASPYRMRSMAAIASRLGKPAARLAWLLVAILAATCGTAIIYEIRPAYVAPDSPVNSGSSFDPGTSVEPKTPVEFAVQAPETPAVNHAAQP